VFALALLLALGFRDQLESLSPFRADVKAQRADAANLDPDTAGQAADTKAASDAQGPNRASYAVAEAQVEQAETDSAATTPPTGDARTRAKLNPQAARALMEENEREVDCELIRTAQAPRAVAERERLWRWLPADIAEMERLAFDDAVDRLGRGCPRWSDDATARQQRRQQRQRNTAAAAQAGDLSALLANSGLNGELAPTLAQAMYDALLSGDPKLIERIGYADMVWSSHGNRSMAEAMGVRRELWTLVACELGLDCLPGGPTLDRYCLRWGICGYPSLEATVRQGISDRTLQVLATQRAELLQRIRSGQIAGLFDPPPNPSGDGP